MSDQLSSLLCPECAKTIAAICPKRELPYLARCVERPESRCLFLELFLQTRPCQSEDLIVD